MLNKEDAAKFFGKLTEEQEKVLENAAAGGMSEKELCSRLRVDEKVFGDYLRTLRKEKESAVFAQEVSPDELTGVAGGYCEGVQDSKFSYTGTYMRDIFLYRYDPFKVIFPNCAAMVKDGSWCGSNDACYENAVRYVGMKSCSKAWK